ncbi:hypothetical protein ACVW1C_002660 [Bradyrhizobium sp. USDA 4011]
MDRATQFASIGYGEQLMECWMITYTLSRGPNIQEQDVRLGRLIMLVVGLSIAVVARPISFPWS